MQNWIDSAFWIVFPLFFVAIWLLVSALISFAGGWATLAGQFRYRASFTGEIFRYESGSMRWMIRYRGCLSLGWSPEGLYLAVMPLFRFCHPPLLIPWQEISVESRQTLFLVFVRLSLGRESRIPLWLRPRVAEKLKHGAGKYWPAEMISGFVASGGRPVA